MRFMGLMFAVAALGVTSQAYSPPPNMATGPNPNVDGSWNSVTIGGLGDTEAEGCVGDCEAVPDGNIGIVDLLTLLAQWGQVGTSCDFNVDGVGVVDLLELLANWGVCP